MKKFIFIFFLILLSFFGLGFIFLDKLAGNSSKKPEDFLKNASPKTIKLVNDSIKNLDQDLIRDYHTHIVGLNKEKNGTFINPKMYNFFHLKEFIRKEVYLSALKIKSIENADEDAILRLISLIKNLPFKSKHFILAFDKNYNQDQTENLEKTEFYTPNEYMYKLTFENKNIFLPCISIHPNKKDAIEELDYWIGKGVKIIKWLPNAQSIDPSDKKFEKFYKKMIQHNIVLLTHAGEEKAVDAEDDQKYGNPLLLKYPLSLGLKIIIAHSASLGNDIDLESSTNQKIPSFDLFIRLMDRVEYKKNLFGDISAITQFNRDERVIKTLLFRQDLHSRLMNGSDYPLPAVNLVIQLRKLKSFLTEEEIISLRAIYDYNPILFDFVLKRSLKWEGKKFSDSIFLENKLLGISENKN